MELLSERIRRDYRVKNEALQLLVRVCQSQGRDQDVIREIEQFLVNHDQLAMYHKAA